MKILLLGEYSRLHNSLKEGLISLAHEVTLVSDGDGFKNFPNDISIRASLTNTFPLRYLKLAIYKIFKIDLNELERGLRCLFILKKIKKFDVVQFINEKPIKTIPSLERYLLKKIFSQNSKVFLLSCGVDTISVKYMMDKKLRYSLMDTYFLEPTLKKEFSYVLEYTENHMRKTHELVFSNIKGVIASDFDYVLPLKNHKKYLGLIPNPVNPNEFLFQQPSIDQKIIIFLGINRGTYHPKGIPFFEKALKIIQDKYLDKVEVIIVENIPYKEYISLYNDAHIILDQVYSYDQGYNALEAMAKGKVVFTGAEKEFLIHYTLKVDEVCINALPNAEYLAKKIGELIEHPHRINEIGKGARAFIEREHDFQKVAKKYLETYNL